MHPTIGRAQPGFSGGARCGTGPMSYELQVTGYALHVTRCELQVPRDRYVLLHEIVHVEGDLVDLWVQLPPNV